MKNVHLHGAQRAIQLAVGMNAPNDPSRVTIAVEKDPDGEPTPHWLLYSADAPLARAIAAQLIRGAEILEGTLSPDDVQNDDAIGRFHEHG